MSTARFSTRRGGEALRAAADVRPLVAFRLVGLRGRSRRAAPVALGVIATITLLCAVGPAFLPEGDLTRHDVLALVPQGFLGVLGISLVSSAMSGGGRELLARDQAVAFPVSPTTDHLGALLMAPLNIAWLLQGWTLLAATSFAVGARPQLVAALLPVLLWLVASTTLAQGVAWAVEWVRRGPRGSLLVRGLAGLVAAAVALLVLTGTVHDALRRSPTRLLARGVADPSAGRWASWAIVLAALLATVAVAVPAGAWLAARVARRAACDESRVETAVRVARPAARSDLAALIRTDRAGIWRSVPMRRGLFVLAVFPGLVAVGGSFRWDTLSIFPGLVASGGALLFGVNAWCLDGRGALWRESLPVSPAVAFGSRVLVLTEILLVAMTGTLALASLRAGLPTVAQVVAVGCAGLVISLQVVATSMRWSVRSPYAVDLRSSRATPAPPLVMVGYSSRLALTTTVTGLLFNTVSVLSWTWPVLLSVPFLAWSGLRLRRTARAWADPSTRARVVATVAS